MRSETLNVPGLSDDEHVTLNFLAKQLADRAPRNELRSAYYDCKHVVRQVGVTIPIQYMRIGMVLGWPAKGVDGLARRCHLSGFTWPEGDLNALGIRELMDSNYLLSELSQGRTDAFLHGVSYLINTRGGDGEPAALIHTKDALNATGEWNNRARRLDSALSVTDRGDRDQITGFALYLDGLTISAEKSDGVWQVDRSEHSFGVPVEPLVYRPRTSRRMGRSRITRPVMGLTDAGVRACIRLEAHMDIYAIAKLILLGADESIFKNPDGTPKSSWQIVMGKILGVPDDDDAENPRADVKQITAESPEPHLAQLNALSKMVARELSLPDSSVAITDFANPTSAEAYDASQHELIAEAEGADDEFSTPLRRSIARGLAMQNGLSEVPAEWAGIEATWRNPRFLSRAAEADAGSKQLGAVPWLAESEVGLELLGLDDQQIRRAMADKRRAAGRGVLETLRAAADRVTAEPVAADGEPV